MSSRAQVSSGGPLAGMSEDLRYGNGQGNLGELDIVSRFDGWRIFASLTFAGTTTPTLPASRKLVFAHLYRSAKLFKVSWHRLCWVIRAEHGEKLGRMHYHFLLGGEIKGVTVGHCFVLNHTWQKLHKKCGFARHRLFDTAQYRRNGIKYVVSCLANEGTIGANLYELSKFGSGDTTLTLANSLFRAIGGKRVDVAK